MYRTMMFGLGKTKIQERRYYPMIVSEKGTEEKMSSEESTIVWNEFENLSPEKKAILLSSEMPQKIKFLEEKLKLSVLDTGNVSLMIRKIYFDDIPTSELEENLQKRLTMGDSKKVKGIIEYIKDQILTIKPAPKVEDVPVEEMPKGIVMIVRLPLLEALSKYEQLGNQLITEERIKLKSQPESVRPSLLYWIKYYRDELGIGHHNSVERGNFLFHSENGKKLTPEERERVNLVLKSVEENYPVEVDTERNVVIFPPFAPQGGPLPQTPPVPPLAPTKVGLQSRMVFQPSRPSFAVTPAPAQGGLTFTTNHVMPGERAENQPVLPQSAPPRPNMPSAPTVPSSPFHIRPVSLGKKE